jgi:hypothetical protein
LRVIAVFVTGKAFLFGDNVQKPIAEQGKGKRKTVAGKKKATKK